MPTSDLAAQRTDDICPYCKGTGQIRFMARDGALTEPVSCKHGLEAGAYIQGMKKEYGYELVNESDLSVNCCATKDCPYCDDRGVLDLRNRYTGKFEIRPCSHNEEKIKQFAREKDAIIASAKPGFEDPNSEKTAVENAKADYQNPVQLSPPPLPHKVTSDGQEILKQPPDFSAQSARQSFSVCSEEEAAALEEIASNPADPPDPETMARFDAVMAKLTAHLAMPR
jgi:hypothetical protein